MSIWESQRESGSSASWLKSIVCESFTQVFGRRASVWECQDCPWNVWKTRPTTAIKRREQPECWTLECDWKWPWRSITQKLRDLARLLVMAMGEEWGGRGRFAPDLADATPSRMQGSCRGNYKHVAQLRRVACIRICIRIQKRDCRWRRRSRASCVVSSRKWAMNEILLFSVTPIHTDTYTERMPHSRFGAREKVYTTCALAVVCVYNLFTFCATIGK